MKNQTSFKKGYIPWNKRKKGLQIGKNCGGWKGGKHINTQGYVLVYNPNHPYCNINKCVFEHRLVIEKYLGRYLFSKEVTHHINSNPSDNRINNLMLFKNNYNHLHYERGIKIEKDSIVFNGELL